MCLSGDYVPASSSRHESPVGGLSYGRPQKLSGQQLGHEVLTDSNKRITLANGGLGSGQLCLVLVRRGYEKDATPHDDITTL